MLNPPKTRVRNTVCNARLNVGGRVMPHGPLSPLQQGATEANGTYWSGHQRSHIIILNRGSVPVPVVSCEGARRTLLAPSRVLIT